MDSMQDAGKYDWAFGLGFMYSYVLTVPHSVAVNLAFPKQIALQGTIPGCKSGMCCHALPCSLLLGFQHHFAVQWQLHAKTLCHNVVA